MTTDQQVKIRADVVSHGWHVHKVFSEDNSMPIYAYTIGLERSFDHPEVVIFGLNADFAVMHRVLNLIGRRVKAGECFPHGSKKRGILSGYRCSFARFPRAAYEDHLGQAIDFHAPHSFRAVQCIWPDRRRRLPWEPGVLPQVLRRQPVFLRPDAGPRDPRWPFREPHSRFVLTSRQVASGREPVRFVGRFRERGPTRAVDWQFVCNTTSDPADMVLVTLGWVVDRDNGLRRLADLRRGQYAERTQPGRPFCRGRMPRG